MSQSGFTNFPAGPKLPGQTRTSENGQLMAVKITDIPPDLRENRKTVKLRGDVVQGNRDGRAKIRTGRGDIEIQVKQGRSDLQPGQKVEIEIPPGRPPQDARVRAETPDSKTIRQPVPQESGQTQPRPSSTPVDIQVPAAKTKQTQTTPTAQPQTSPEAQPPRPGIPFTEGQIVRLEPLPPAQAAQYNLEPAKQILSRLPQLVENAAQIIALKTEIATTQELLNTAAPKPFPTTPQTLPVVINAAAQPLDIIPDLQTRQTPAPQNIYQAIQQIVESAAVPAPLENIVQPFAVLSPPQIQTAAIAAAPGQTAPDMQTSAAFPKNLVIQLPQTPAAQTITAPVQGVSPLSPGPLKIENQNFFNIRIVSTSEAPPQIFSGHQQAAPAAKTTSPNLTTPAVTGKTEHLQNLILQNTKAETIPAIITGKTEHNLPILQFFPTLAGTAEGLFFVAHIPAETITPGTQISVTPLQNAGANAPITAAITLPPPVPAYFLTPESWPLMQDIRQTLAQIAPQVAQAMVNVTPSASSPAQMGPAALFFIAAVRGGDLSQWLGDKAVETLRRAGRTGLLTRLGQEGNALNRLASEPVSQDWRALSLPMFWEGEMQKIALHYKHDEYQGEQKDEKGKQTRFIFDLTLDQMGKVQLDALYRPSRLDLILRTEERFSQAVQMDMRRRYTGALEQVSITGELSFQNRPDQWVTITQEKQGLGITT